jgi:hypothetical protein
VVECLDRDIQRGWVYRKGERKEELSMGFTGSGLHKEANFCYFTAFAWSERMESCRNRHFAYLFHWM